MTTAIPSLSHVMNDQALFAETFLRILNKDKRLVPLHYNKPQRRYLTNATRKDIILKARQFGLSTAIQSKVFKRAVTETITSLTLAHDDESTQALRRISERFYDEWPSPFPRPLRGQDNATITTYPDTGSEVICATAGKLTAGRSLTITFAHLSEVAFWTDPDTVMTGLLEAVPEKSGQVVIESTANGQGGWFYETCMAALKGEGEWTLHFYPWWYGEDYATPLEPGETLTFTEEELYLIDMHDLTPEQIKWRRAKQLRMKDKFPQEYPEDPIKCFISLDGTTVFRNVWSVVSEACPFFDLDTHAGEQAARAYVKSNPRKRFVIGADWARENDYSVFTVMDCHTWEVVAIMRIRHLDWHIQRARLMTLHDIFQAERIISESNDGGRVNNSALLQSQLPIQPFNTNEKTKKLIIDGLNEAIEQRLIILPAGVIGAKDDVRNVLLDELNAFKITRLPSGNYRQEAPKGMHDDMVLSLAFALFGCKLSGRGS